MKKLISILAVLGSVLSFAQTGYEIKVTLKPFRNQYIYLGHYQGKQYPIVDSAKLDANGTTLFKGKKTLPGGIYLVGFPDKKGFFEMLIDKQQRFSLVADTSTLKKGIAFTNSTDNTLFNGYQIYMNEEGKKINDLKGKLSRSKTAADSAAVQLELEKTDKAIRTYREDIMKNNPKSMLTALLMAMREPELNGNLKNPANKEDSVAAYRYFKDHFWDGVNFWDGRLAYTTFFEDKVDKYYSQLIMPHADSVIREMDLMLAYATPSYEMTKLLLLKFVNKYINQRYMWEDAVFVHLYEKYFAAKDYDWLTPAGRKTVTDRAFSLMENIVGKPAADILLPDSSGVMHSLYTDTTATLTLVCFWDVTCGHCKETLPKMDSLYRAKWKAANVKVFAVSKETDGKPAEWKKFIAEQQLEGWTHVYYSKAAENERITNNIPGYSQLYDIQTFPTLYLLDKQKRIIAKKLDYDKMDEIITIKLKD
jgi:thiol-disulfide isomerase/thioredoxin